MLDESRKLLQQLVRTGKQDSARMSWGSIIMAAAFGTPVRRSRTLIAGYEGTVRAVTHAFNETGLCVLNP